MLAALNSACTGEALPDLILPTSLPDKLWGYQVC